MPSGSVLSKNEMPILSRPPLSRPSAWLTNCGPRADPPMPIKRSERENSRCKQVKVTASAVLNKVVPRDQLEDTVEEMARKIGQIPLTTLMAVKSSVKQAWELMGMRVHLQMSHAMTNMVGAASDVQARRAELIQSGLKPRDFVADGENSPGNQ